MRLEVGRSVAQPGSALASGARGREFESPRSDQSNQRLGFELGTLGDVFGDVFISKKTSLHTFTKRVRGKNSQYSSSLNHAHLMSKSFKPGDAPREGQRVDRELSDRSVRPCMAPIEDVHCAVSVLRKSYVAGRRSLGRTIRGASATPCWAANPACRLEAGIGSPDDRRFKSRARNRHYLLFNAIGLTGAAG